MAQLGPLGFRTLVLFLALLLAPFTHAQLLHYCTKGGGVLVQTVNVPRTTALYNVSHARLLFSYFFTSTTPQ